MNALDHIMGSPVEQITAIINEIGFELRKPSLIPDWMAHETSARLKGNDPRHHLVGSASHKAWMRHSNKQFMAARAARWQQEQDFIASFVGPTRVLDGSLAGVESVASDKVRFGGDY